LSAETKPPVACEATEGRDGNRIPRPYHKPDQVERRLAELAQDLEAIGRTQDGARARVLATEHRSWRDRLADFVRSVP
jgi:hypothetical protein